MAASYSIVDICGSHKGHSTHAPFVEAKPHLTTAGLALHKDCVWQKLGAIAPRTWLDLLKPKDEECVMDLSCLDEWEAPRLWAPGNS